MDLLALIDMRPEVRGGKPCFVGTRITVYDVLFSGESGTCFDADQPEKTG